MKTLPWRKCLNFVGAALVAGYLSTGCSSVGKLVQKQEHDNSHLPLEARLIPFQQYSPVPAQEKLTLNDKMLEAYVLGTYSLNELSLSILNPHLAESGINDPIRKADIGDYNGFKAGVISVAEELGFSQDDLRKLSIHDTIMLSGKIVAHKLDYDNNMISEEEKEISKDPTLLYSTLVEELFLNEKVDRRNDKARDVDNSTKDKIFFDGGGICRNYAGVNSAVFEILKDLNPNLRNTYMRWYSPDDTGHSLALPHAWNQVLTITEDDKCQEILITYVDPTWLDTRNKTVENTGERLNRVGDEDIYNGLDVAHFGVDTLLARSYLANLYEILGNESRTYNQINFFMNDVLSYGRKAFEQRMELCVRILDIAESNPKDFENFDYYLGESFMKGIEVLTESSIGIFLEYGYDSIHPKNMNQFEEVRKIYERALKIVPEFVMEDNMDYICASEFKKLSIQDLFEKVQFEYLKN